MRKSFKTNFSYGQRVFLITDPGTIRIVTGFLLRKGSVTIGLAQGPDNETWHQMDEVMPLGADVIVVKGFRR